MGSQDPATFTVTYHSSPEDASSGSNALSSPLNASSQTIYVRVEESGLPNCYDTTQFDIIVDLPPTIITNDDLNATADPDRDDTVNTDQTLVWYDSTCGTMPDPSLTGVGTVTYYAEAIDDVTGCISTARTAVSLTIQEAPPAPIAAASHRM